MIDTYNYVINKTEYTPTIYRDKDKGHFVNFRVLRLIIFLIFVFWIYVCMLLVLNIYK